MQRSAIASFLVAACAAPVVAQDTLVVRADGPAFWGENLRLVEEVRIGALEGDPRYTFGRVSGVAPLSDGSVWVADGQAQVVRRYDTGGRHLLEVGGPGEGPGEFKGIMEAAPYRGDSVAVWDAHAWRISIVDAEGRLGRTLTAGFQGSILGGPLRQFVVDREGGFWIVGIDRPDQNRGEETPWIWKRADAEGRVLDTLPQPRRDIDGPYVGGQSYGLGAMAAFGTHTMTAVSPAGYLVTARNDEYAVHRPLRDGRVVRIERSWDPVPVDADERRQFQANVEHMVPIWEGRYDFSTEVADTKPPFWALWVDDDARIWVARHVEARHRPETDAERSERERLAEIRGSMPPPMEWWEPVTLDVFEPNGRFLGTVELASPDSRPVRASGRTLWTVERGEFDEEYVVRWRIEAGN